MTTTTRESNSFPTAHSRVLNQSTGDSYTCSTVPEFSSMRHAHGKRRAAIQACAQRTLRWVYQCHVVRFSPVGKGVHSPVDRLWSISPLGEVRRQSFAVLPR